MAKKIRKGLALLMALILITGQLAVPVTAATTGTESTDPLTGDQTITVTEQQTTEDTTITSEITIEASGDVIQGQLDLTNEADPIQEPQLQEHGTGQIQTTQTDSSVTLDDQDRPVEVIEEETSDTQSNSSTASSESLEFTEEIENPTPVEIPIPPATDEEQPQPELTPPLEDAETDGYTVDSTTEDTTWEVKEDENGEPMVTTTPAEEPTVKENSQADPEPIEVPEADPNANLNMPVEAPANPDENWGEATVTKGMSLNQLAEMLENQELVLPETLPEGLGADTNRDTPLSGAQIEAILEGQGYQVSIDQENGKMNITRDKIETPVLPEIQQEIPVSETDNVTTTDSTGWTDVESSKASNPQEISQWQDILNADAADLSVVKREDGSAVKTQTSEDGKTITQQDVYRDSDGSYSVHTTITKTETTSREATAEELAALSFVPAAIPVAGEGETVNTLNDEKGNPYYQVLDSTGAVKQTITGTYVGEREQVGSVVSDVIQAVPPTLADNQTLQTLVDSNGNNYYIVTTTSTGPDGETITSTEEFRATYTTTTTYQTFRADSMTIEETVTTTVMYGQNFSSTLHTKTQERTEEGTLTNTVTVDGERESYEITTNENGDPIFVYNGVVYEIVGEANVKEAHVANGGGDIYAGMDQEEEENQYDTSLNPTWYNDYKTWREDNPYTWIWVDRRGNVHFGMDYIQDEEEREAAQPQWYKDYIAGEDNSGKTLMEDLEELNRLNAPSPNQNQTNSNYWSQSGAGSDKGLTIYDTNRDSHSTTMFTIRGKNEDEVRTVYCVEMAEGASGGVYFSDLLTENPEKYEDIGEWSDNVLPLRSVAVNGYWGTTSGVGSLDAVKDLLRKHSDLSDTVINGLTEEEAIAGTQAALWQYGGKTGVSFDENILSRKADETSEDRVAKLREILVTLAEQDKNNFVPSTTPASGETTGETGTVPSGGESSQPEQVFAGAVQAIDAAAVEQVGIHVKETTNTAGVYKSDVTFKLNVSESSINGDLLVEVVDASGASLGKYRLSDDGGNFMINGAAAAADYISGTKKLKADANGTYTIPDLMLASGAKFNLKLRGTQHLDEGVIIYQQEGLQDFISLVSKENWVDVNIEMGFSVEAPTATKKTEEITQSASQTITYTKKDSRSLSKLVEDTLTGGAEGWTTGTRKVTVEGSLVVDVESTSQTQTRRTVHTTYPEPTEPTVPTEPTEPTDPSEPTEPDIPTIPGDPGTPDDPTPPEGPGGGGVPVPANLDYEDGVPFVVIDETPVPMAVEPAIVVRPQKDGVTTIEDEMVPLADAPETGDPTLILGAVGLMSLAGSSLLGKKKKEEEA